MTEERRQAVQEILQTNIIVGRVKARLSQGALAQRAGVSREIVAAIEFAEGDVGIGVVGRLADALGVSISELFVPATLDTANDDDLARRAGASTDEYIDSRMLLVEIGKLLAIRRAKRANERKHSRSCANKLPRVVLTTKPWDD